MTRDPHKTKQEILKITEQCVRCGMCLPHCPTSNLTNLEGQSPRGRIALWQNLALNKLKLTTKTVDYLDHCLGCGACANNCPAGVKFLTLQELGINFIKNNYSILKSAGKNINPQRFYNTSNNLLNKIITRILSSRYMTTLLHHMLYILQKLRVNFIVELVLKLMPKINHLYKLLPNINAPNKLKNLRLKKSLINNQDNVILFTGCVNKIADYKKIKASVELLNRLNINPIVVKDLHCCGALCKHNGNIDLYQKIVDSNKQAVRTLCSKLENKYDLAKIKILTLDTGCHTEIHKQFESIDYLEVINIEQYLYNKLLLNNKLSLNSKIYIHNPCSQVEQLKQPDLIYNLLSLMLPRENLITLTRGYGCCGAAGSYMLKHPDTATKLGRKIIDEFLQANPSLTTQQDKLHNNNIIIVTSNVGCLLHLKKLFSTQYNLNIEIISVIELLNREIRLII